MGDADFYTLFLLSAPQKMLFFPWSLLPCHADEVTWKLVIQLAHTHKLFAVEICCVMCALVWSQSPVWGVFLTTVSSTVESGMTYPRLVPDSMRIVLYWRDVGERWSTDGSPFSSLSPTSSTLSFSFLLDRESTAVFLLLWNCREEETGNGFMKYRSGGQTLCSLWACYKKKKASERGKVSVRLM